MRKVDFSVNQLPILFLLVAFCGQGAHADLGPEEYRCPLLGPYAVRRADLSDSTESFGRYQLVKITDFGSGISSSFVVERLNKVAVNGSLIVGTMKSGFFIFDTSQPDSEAQKFADADKWQAALKAANVPVNIQLNDPDELAAATPDFQLHPLHYFRMKRLFGLSDDGWGGIVILTTLAIIFLRGLLMPPNASLFPLAFFLGCLVTVALIVLAVIDVGGLLGFIVYPGAYWLVGKLGQFFRRFIWDAATRRRDLQ